MEPEGSLPQSQVPATCPYPEPARTSPHPTSHLLKIHLNIILPSMTGYPMLSPSFRFPHQNHLYASPLPHTRHTHTNTHVYLLININQLDALNFYNKFISSLYMFRAHVLIVTRANIVLDSLWYHHTYRWLSGAPDGHL